MTAAGLFRPMERDAKYEFNRMDSSALRPINESLRVKGCRFTLLLLIITPLILILILGFSNDITETLSKPPSELLIYLHASEVHKSVATSCDLRLAEQAGARCQVH